MIIDTPTNVQNYARRLAAAGVTTVIRYESRLPNAGWKRWQPDEMKALAATGLHCGIVYEDDGRPHGYSDGYDAALYALKRCEARGQPAGSAVYYAVDFDAGVSDVNNRVVPYFHGVNKAHLEVNPKIKIGCYGSGMVTRVLQATKLIDLRWITCSLGFSGSRQAVRAGDYDLWQAHCDTHLMGIDVDINVARVPDFGQFLPWGPAIVPAPAEPQAFAALQDSMEIAFSHGRGSWYSQFNGIYHWHDSGDAPGSSALGVPDDCQGVSFYNHHTLGTWFEVHAPNGQVLLLQQTDVGPAPWTGRLIDIASVSAERFGYSPSNFPTNAEFHWRQAQAPEPVRQLSPRQQAVKWKQIRQQTPAAGIMNVDSDVADRDRGTHPMNQAQFLAILRIVLPMLIAYAVKGGWVDAGMVGDLVNALTTLASVIWGVVAHTNAKKIAAVAALDRTDVSSDGRTITVLDSTLAKTARDNATPPR